MPKRHEFKTEAEWLEHLKLWFAGMALQGMLPYLFSLSPTAKDAGLLKDGQALVELAAKCSYEAADAMLAERNRKEGEK